MPSFRFRAAAALELRRKQESASQAALARAEAHLHALSERRAETARRITEARSSQLARERTGLDGADLGWHRTWIDQLAVSAERLGQQIDAQARVVADARRAWLEARKRRRALERMRERAWERFTDAEAREENKALDEVARLRFVMFEGWRDDP